MITIMVMLTRCRIKASSWSGLGSWWLRSSNHRHHRRPRYWKSLFILWSECNFWFQRFLVLFLSRNHQDRRFSFFHAIALSFMHHTCAVFFIECYFVFVLQLPSHMRRLLEDTFANSLKYVNLLYTKTFGSESRKVRQCWWVIVEFMNEKFRFFSSHFRPSISCFILFSFSLSFSSCSFAYG
jgi:hypothetical protein